VRERREGRDEREGREGQEGRGEGRERRGKREGRGERGEGGCSPTLEVSLLNLSASCFLSSLGTDPSMMSHSLRFFHLNRFARITSMNRIVGSDWLNTSTFT
jgi:hypothetical protein